MKCRVLVARLDSDGDVLLAGPAVRAVAAAPHTEVTLLCGPGGATDYAELAGVLRGADAVIVGNTRPAHLAAAVGTPVVSLFSPVVPAARWAPYGVPSVLLGDQTAPCRGTRARECPVPGHPCLSSVTETAVVEAVHALITTRGRTCVSR